MNISIWDLDWYHKWSSIPNITAMKLSSYHIQCGDKINFITSSEHIGMACDRMYIIKDYKRTPLPPRNIIDSNKTVLLGRGWEYYKVSSISAVVAACRPDYMLYDTPERDSYANANFVSFYHNGQLLKQQQDFHNTKKHHKKTLVSDPYFWKAKDEEIIWCLDYLKDEKNVAFLEPISLQRLLTNVEIQQKFLALNFSIGTKFKWRNDYGSTVAAATTISELLLQLRTHTKSNLGFVPFRGIMLDHKRQYNCDIDLIRCFQIVQLFKQKCLQAVIIAGDRQASIYYDTFERIEHWTRTLPKLSYIEYVTRWFTVTQGVIWYDILNNPIKWRDKTIDLLLYWLTSQSWEDYRMCLAAQWNWDTLNLNKLNLDEIRNKLNLLYRDTN